MDESHIQIRAATIADKVVLGRMLELYQYDLSDIWEQDIDRQGEYGYQLDQFFESTDCHAFIATANQQYAAFALVNRHVKISSDGYWMDQFFVLKKYRRSGIGKMLAQHVFSQLAGTWEVGQMTLNTSARAFWRNVIDEFSGGNFTEQELTNAPWEGFIQCFGTVGIGGTDIELA